MTITITGSNSPTAGGAAYGDGSNLAFTSAGTSGQVLTSAGSGTPTWQTPYSGITWASVQTGNFNATAGNAYPINTTSSAITVTLPASPTAGQQIILTDYAGTWATNNVTVNPNGNKVIGQTGNGTLLTNYATCSLVYIDSTKGWISYSNVTPSYAVAVIEYLVVSGGGGGGMVGAGGGAGGYRTASGFTVYSAGSALTVTVGAGGAGSSNINTVATSGNNSVFSSITSTGGGGGRSGGENTNGVTGGSGGGAANATYTGGSGNSGGYSPVEGYAGGNGATSACGGGGGGSSAVGANGNRGTNTAGNGGSGTANSITGSSVTYAGGGGGGINQGTAGTGGSGGGGNGSNTEATVGSNGTANTGGGGGGGGSTNGVSFSNGGTGGSGVVILRTLSTAASTTGSPTVTTDGSYNIYKFTSSGSITF